MAEKEETLESEGRDVRVREKLEPTKGGDAELKTGHKGVHVCVCV